MFNNTHSVRPLAWGTGGVLSSLQGAIDACADDHREQWAPIWECGGPIDAPDNLPTGAVTVSHARRFFTLTSREA